MATLEPILKDRYEVVVIGAGIGGLSAASVLARERAEVLVLEQAQEPGGCCSSIRLGDFTFDAAASILQGFGEIGFNVMRSLFDFLRQQVDLIPRNSAYAMVFGDQRVDFHRDRHAYTAELGAIFPQQAGSILAYFRELEHLYHSVLDCSGPLRPSSDEAAGLKLGMMARHPASLARVRRAQRTSASRILDRHTNDPVVRAFFDADAVFNTGYTIEELSASHAALFALDRHIGGTHHAIGSAQQVADRLEKSINEHGGRVAYRVPVERIIVEGGSATGVRLADGRRIRADVVIANTSARDLYGRMLPAQALKRQTIEWFESLEPSPGVVALYLGVPEAAIPEDFNPNTVLVDDPERNPGRFISVSIPSLFDPNLSPEGYHSVTIHAVTDHNDWPHPDDPSYPSDDYQERKDSAARSVTERLEPLLPGVVRQSVVHAVATPSTFERILRRGNASLAGPRVPGMLVPVSLPGAVTEIKGLFLAGDSTFFGRGVAEVSASGLHCALVAMHHLGMKAPRFHGEGESFVLETVPVRPQISGESVVDSISAVLESHRCMRCDQAPCTEACPARVDIPNFIRRIAATDFAGAARLIRESNPLAEVCGLVCPAASLCEGACSRSLVDTPVKISQLEAFVSGYVPGPEGWPERYRGPRRERVAVVGSGPAGLACAFYLSMLGYTIEVFEEDIDAGGLPARAMTDFRLHRQVLLREIEGAMTAGIEFRGNTSFGEDVNLDFLGSEGFQAVFIATGQQAIKPPEIRGVDLPGVIDALSFLGAARRRVKRELTPNVAVVGNENIAVDTALLSLEMGAENVYLVTAHRDGSIEVPDERLEEARGAGVKVLTNRRVVELLGEGRVEALRAPVSTGGHTGVQDDESGGAAGFLEVGTVILAGEREPPASLAGYLQEELEINLDGTVRVDAETLATSRPGVFAGGEVVTGGGLVVEACEHGRRAAVSIDRFLRSRSPEQNEPAQEGSADIS